MAVFGCVGSKAAFFWRLFSLCAVSCFAVSVYSAESLPGPSTRGDDSSLDSRISLGAGFTRLRLISHGDSPFEGNLWGVGAMYEYRPKRAFYGALELIWKQGDTHGSAGKRSLDFLDSAERLGYTFFCARNEIETTLFSGLGFRYVRQKFVPEGGSSLTFHYKEFYVPVGLHVGVPASRRFSWGIDLQWMPQVYPTVRIVPVNGTHWSLERKLGNWSAAIPVNYVLDARSRWQISFRPFFEYWQDGHSTAKQSDGVPLGLPGNTYFFYGADLHLSFWF